MEPFGSKPRKKSRSKSAFSHLMEANGTRERERGLNYVEQSEMSSKAEVNFNGTSNYFYV